MTVTQWPRSGPNSGHGPVAEQVTSKCSAIEWSGAVSMVATCPIRIGLAKKSYRGETADTVLPSVSLGVE